MVKILSQSHCIVFSPFIDFENIFSLSLLICKCRIVYLLEKGKSSRGQTKAMVLCDSLIIYYTKYI